MSQLIFDKKIVEIACETLDMKYLLHVPCMGESDLGKVSKPRSLITLQMVKTEKSGKVEYSTTASLSRNET